ncbi:hypothetical protein FOCG_17980 [Fusarium oxysporum f. sp. radicis-lycopersici 26381]|nr:hypothetical protein FOCG_17980 [Fusarium oxysporum f. sp. radicis-lycopersici 26381]
MAGTSLWDYIFIRASIFLLHFIAPLSVAYSLVNLLARLPFQFPRVLQAWLGLEALFYLAVYLPLNKYLQRAAKHPVPPCRADRRKLFLRCHQNIPDPAQYLRKWFRNAPVSEIKRDNVKDFFRWAFLNTGDHDSTYDEELEEYTQEIEKLLGKKLEPGRGNAKCLRLTLEKVEMLHRSLTWYLCVFVVDTIASISLRYHSFNFHRTSFSQFFTSFPLRLFTLFATCTSHANSLTYWHRPHTSKTRLPILFIHGIGVGLYPYINFLADINAHDAGNSSDGQVGIIAIEIMSVSSRITYEAMLKDEMCDEVRRILTAHRWEKCVLVSHSYGSVVAAQLIRSPEVSQHIGPALFIDPVSFLLHLPEVAYNFICRRPSQPNEYLLSYFGSKDIGIAHTLFRRFFWADNLLWKEDIRDHPVTVVLAGRDSVIDTKAIRAYLLGSDNWILETTDLMDLGQKGDRLDVIWFQDLDHGQVFDEKRTRSSLVEIVWTFCKK